MGTAGAQYNANSSPDHNIQPLQRVREGRGNQANCPIIAILCTVIFDNMNLRYIKTYSAAYTTDSSHNAVTSHGSIILMHSYALLR